LIILVAIECSIAALSTTRDILIPHPSASENGLVDLLEEFLGRRVPIGFEGWRLGDQPMVARPNGSHGDG
jgi:hypothetical protein